MLLSDNGGSQGGGFNASRKVSREIEGASRNLVAGSWEVRCSALAIGACHAPKFVGKFKYRPTRMRSF